MALAFVGVHFIQRIPPPTEVNPGQRTEPIGRSTSPALTLLAKMSPSPAELAPVKRRRSQEVKPQASTARRKAAAYSARKAASLGRSRKTKLPDLLIAATALALNVPLIKKTAKL